jgi:hypothetical protein
MMNIKCKRKKRKREGLFSKTGLFEANIHLTPNPSPAKLREGNRL